MCINIYLGSDSPLPAIPWDEADPGFHLQPVEVPAVLGTLRDMGFSFPHILQAGSFLGCACGLSFGDWSCENPEEEHARRVRDVAALFGYLAVHRRRQHITVFSPDYDGVTTGIRRAPLDPAAVPASGEDFGIPENVLLEVVLPPDPPG
jgi:hypothetical protein